jgi:hypothetical protein
MLSSRAELAAQRPGHHTTRLARRGTAHSARAEHAECGPRGPQRQPTTAARSGWPRPGWRPAVAAWRPDRSEQPARRPARGRLGRGRWRAAGWRPSVYMTANCPNRPTNFLRAYPRRRAHWLQRRARGGPQKTRVVHPQHRRHRTSKRPTQLPLPTPLRSNALTQTRCTSGAPGPELGLSERSQRPEKRSARTPCIWSARAYEVGRTAQAGPPRAVGP